MAFLRTGSIVLPTLVFANFSCLGSFFLMNTYQAVLHSRPKHRDWPVPCPDAPDKTWKGDIPMLEREQTDAPSPAHTQIDSQLTPKPPIIRIPPYPCHSRLISPRPFTPAESRPIGLDPPPCPPKGIKVVGIEAPLEEGDPRPHPVQECGHGVVRGRPVGPRWVEQ